MDSKQKQISNSREYISIILLTVLGFSEYHSFFSLMLTTQILLIKPSADVGSCHIEVYSCFSYNLSIIHWIRYSFLLQNCRDFSIRKMKQKENPQPQTDILAHSFSGMLGFTFGFFSQYGSWAECQLSTDQPELWGGVLILMKSLFEYKWNSTEPVKSRMEL